MVAPDVYVFHVVPPSIENSRCVFGLGPPPLPGFMVALTSVPRQTDAVLGVFVFKLGAVIAPTGPTIVFHGQHLQTHIQTFALFT